MNHKITAFYRIVSLSIVLLLTTSGVHAGDKEARAERREARIERRLEQRQQEERVQQERRGEQLPVEVQAEPARKPGRMTPEERRALRRQINEAGQDIYQRKH